MLTNSSYCSFDLAGLEFLIFVVTMALVISDQSECFICGRMDEPQNSMAFVQAVVFKPPCSFIPQRTFFVNLPVHQSRKPDRIAGVRNLNTGACLWANKLWSGP